MKVLNDNEEKKPHDLMGDIMKLGELIKAEAKRLGYKRFLMNGGQVSVEPHEGPAFVAANFDVGFKPALGLDHTLHTLVTDSEHSRPIDTHEARRKVAKLFGQHMKHLVGRAEETARESRAIRRAAQQVFDEAREEGIELEFMRIEPAPQHIYHEPGHRGNDHRQVFYVHIMMPHDDKGRLTEDTWTIDADLADEFGDYLRGSLLPELRELRKRFAAKTDA